MLNIIWAEGVEGALYCGRSRYACVTMLNEQLDQFECSHWSGWEGVPKDAEGAIIIIHGGNQRGLEQEFNERCTRFRWVVFVIIGDEENAFKPQFLSHPNCRIWVQPGKPTTYGDRFFPVGYPNDCHEMLKKYGDKDGVRDIDVSFAGQHTHQRRLDCVTAIESLSCQKTIVRTSGFGQGLDHPTYFNLLSRSRIVPCPSGPEMPDSYRMAEALEAGAVPIIDAVSLRREPGYWKHVFGEHPLPEVQEWSELPALTEKILTDWETYHRITQTWWNSWKQNFMTWLETDLKILGAK